jgi:hypothetical protein
LFSGLQMKIRYSAVIAVIALALLSTIFTSSYSPYARADDTSPNSEWYLSITGLVDLPLNLSLSDLKSMPQTTENATLYCVDFPGVAIAGGSQGLWTGVKLSDLLHLVGIQPGALKVAFYASDGYTTDLYLFRAAQDDVLLAYAKNGTDLGEVLRLVVPGNWGYKWISQVTRIDVVNYNYLGVWESKGYSDEGTISLGAPEKLPTVEVPASFPPTLQTPKPTASPETTPSPTPESTNPTSPEPTPTITSTPTSLQTPSPTAPSTSPHGANAEAQHSAFPVVQLAAAAAVIAIVVIAGIVFLQRKKRRKLEKRAILNTL